MDIRSINEVSLAVRMTIHRPQHNTIIIIWHKCEDREQKLTWHQYKHTYTCTHTDSIHTHSQTVVLLNQLSSLLAAMNATVIACSFSPLSSDWKKKQYTYYSFWSSVAEEMTHIIECVEFLVRIVMILRYILTKLSCSRYRMTTTDMSGLGRATDLHWRCHSGSFCYCGIIWHWPDEWLTIY